MNEFLVLAALITFVATATGLLLAAAAHYALSTDRPRDARSRKAGTRAQEAGTG